MPDRTCSVDGCDRPHYARGFCSKHYNRMRRLGSATVVVQASGPRGPWRSPVDRFIERVDKAGPVAKNRPDLGRCWIWNGNRGDGRYGLFYLAGRAMNAHRAGYELLVGPVPEGLVLDHFACENKVCVNPAHLIPVTQRENIRREWDAKDTCRNGHPITEATIYMRPDGSGHRDCRLCRKAALARYKARREDDR